MAVINKQLTELTEEYMISYMMSVMEERAIADVRDGFKPVQRYNVWSSYEKGFTPKKDKVKCAMVVGNVIADYSPHGDASAYAALCRMAQDFSVNIPLIDFHGNKGTINGDSPAAYRYTECRLSKYAMDICENINKNSVDFVPNYSNLKEEPTVLPSSVLNLLINGSLGIASGFMQSIPPHNINDVCDMTIKLLKNPDTSLDYIASHLRPDFPTGGIICNNSEMTNAYKTGKGVIKIRCHTEIETKKNGTSVITITDMPYLVTIGPRITPGSTNNLNSGLINSIVEKIKDGTIDGISDIQDSSDKKIAIKIFLKKDVDPNVVLNKLYKNTLMESSYKIQLVCLNDKHFDQYNIKRIFEEFIDFRRKTIKRITVYDINKIKERIHILEGLIMALKDIDNVVEIIRNSKDKDTAKIKLKKKYSNMTTVQIEYILDMKLSQLTSLGLDNLINEKKEKEKNCKELINSLKPENIDKRIIEEQEEYKKKYGYERRTELSDINTNITDEDIIEDEDVIITLNSDGYIKRIPANVFKAQKRNTQGNNINDDVTDMFSTSTKEHLLCFTNQGRVFDIKVFRIKETSVKSKGTKIESYLKLQENEKVCKVLCLKDDKFERPDSCLIFATQNGLAKKTKLEDFKNIKSTGIIAISLRDNDELVCVDYIDNEEKMQDLIFATKNGLIVRYNHEEFSPTGRSTYGCTAINLSEDDKLISSCIIKDEKDKIFFATKNGLAKTVLITDIVKKKDPNTKKMVNINDGFPRLKRSSLIKGRIGIKLNENDELIKILPIRNEDINEVIVVTENKVLMVSTEEFLNPLKRATFGKKLISLTDNSFVKNIILR